jgi:hypothetical protein
MNHFSRFARVSITALVGFASAMPAQAALTTFANFTGINSDAGVRFDNNGTGGSLYTIDSPIATTPGSRLVKFSFLQSALSALSDVTASFTMLGSTTSVAQLTGSFLIQPNITGAFSFLSTTALTIGGTNYAAGSNLLSGSFTDVTIAGQTDASSAAYSGSTGGGAAISFTSDFVTFAPGSDYDLSISLSSLAPLLSATPGNALNSFSAYSTGSFSSEPAPAVNAVPEPSVWGLMIVGFGLVGVQARRRNGVKAIAA